MKLIKLFFIAFIFSGFAQNAVSQSAEVPQEVIAALTNGDASKISQYLNANVELVIGAKNDIYSRQQATGIIADFFRKNSVSGFQVIHKGTKESSSFVVGTLRTSRGTYRVSLLTRKNGNEPIIQQLRIEDND